MSTSQALYQRKRRCPPQSLDDSTEPLFKRTKHCNKPSPSVPPVHYLDTLSKIWLTREALRELDRRSRRARSDYQHRPQYRRPLTRGYHAELRSKVRSTRTSASHFVRQCTSKTVKELKAFAKHGGPDLLDLRGYPEPAHPSRYTMSSIQSSRRHKHSQRGSASTSRTQPTTTDTTATKVTKSRGSAGPNFRQRMIDNSIYPYGYEYPDGRVPPKSEEWPEIQQMLTQDRDSLSPSVFPEEEYERFARADAQVRSEDDARERVISIIQGASRNTNRVGRNTPFNNIANMFPREDNLAEEVKKGPVSGRLIKPDYYYGAQSDQLPSQIRNELGDRILPSTDDSQPMLPNFFVEAKGPSGSNAVCLNQACIDGAIGTRAMHSLQTYGQEVPEYDSRARTLSATYHAGTLKMYAHHVGQPNGPGTQPEYYMNQLKAWAMTSDRETLVKGITAFRNGVEWAEAQRNAAIKHANAVANGVSLNDDNIDDKVGEDNTNEDIEDEDDEDIDDEDDEDIDDKDDEDIDDEDDEDNDEEVELTATTIDPILSSFTSESPFSTGQTSSRRSRTARQGLDTSADERDRRRSKRPMREKDSRQKRRNGGHSSFQHSSTSIASQQVQGWAWKDGAFQYNHGDSPPRRQSAPPTDAWVYCEQGWPYSGGKKWCWMSVTGHTQYQ